MNEVRVDLPMDISNMVANINYRMDPLQRNQGQQSCQSNDDDLHSHLHALKHVVESSLSYFTFFILVSTVFVGMHLCAVFTQTAMACTLRCQLTFGPFTCTRKIQLNQRENGCEQCALSKTLSTPQELPVLVWRCRFKVLMNVLLTAVQRDKKKQPQCPDHFLYDYRIDLEHGDQRCISWNTAQKERLGFASVLQWCSHTLFSSSCPWWLWHSQCVLLQ